MAQGLTASEDLDRLTSAYNLGNNTLDAGGGKAIDPVIDCLPDGSPAPP